MQEFDAKKAIQFVVVFLPGFVSLALVDSVTGLPFSHFEFVYVAILLSVVIYFSAHQMSSLCKRKMKKEESQWPKIIFVGSNLVLILSFAFIVSISVKNDYLPRGVNLVFGSQFQKLSENDVFRFVLKHRQDCTLFDVRREKPAQGAWRGTKTS